MTTAREDAIEALRFIATDPKVEAKDRIVAARSILDYSYLDAGENSDDSDDSGDYLSASDE